MFDYTIYPDNSPKEFKRACARIEEYFFKVQKKELLIDVDGSTIQKYFLDGKKIIVFDDYDVGAVFVESEIELPIFG